MEAGAEKGISFDRDWFLRFWCEAINDRRGLLWTASRDGKTVGVLCALFWKDDFSGRLLANERHWYVSKSARGTPAGGRLLLAYEKEARRRGCDEVYVSAPVRGYKLDNQALYKKDLLWAE